MTLGEARWTGPPTLAAHPDGHLEAFAVGLDGRVYRNRQGGPGLPFGPTWTAFGASLDGQDVRADPLGTRVACAVDRDRRMTIFVRTRAGRLVYAYTGPFADGWSGWHTLSAADRGDPPAGNPAASASVRAAPLLVVRGVDNTALLKHRGPRPTAWGDGDQWTRLGGLLAGEPTIGTAVGTAPDSAFVAFFAVGLDHDMWTNYLGNPDPTTWSRTAVAEVAGARLAGPPVAPSANEVVWRGENGSAWLCDVPVPGRIDRSSLRDLRLPAAGDPAVAQTGTTTWVFARAVHGLIWMTRRHHGGGWERAVPVSPPSSAPAIGDPAVAVGGDGRVELVYLGADARFHHLRQTTVPDGTFHEDR